MNQGGDRGKPKAPNVTGTLPLPLQPPFAFRHRV
jgi:hypothetical protein